MKKIILLLAVLSISFVVVGQSFGTGQNSILTRTYTTENSSKSIEDIIYYDGLGYPSQIVNIGASRYATNSIVTPVYYDAMRRESRQYMPYVATGNSGQYYQEALSSGPHSQVAFYNNMYGNDADSYSYTENIYDGSPLNRIVATYNAGSVFRSGNGIKSTFAYETNAGNEVLLFRVNKTISSSGDIVQSLSVSNYYNANRLYKNTMTNEDGAKVETFKDFQDRVVLERTFGDTDNNTEHDTYYVYDDCNNLCYVLPPKLSDAITSGELTDLSDSNTTMKELAYVYKYDGRNRCAEKRLPGAEPVYMVYDNCGRLVMTQDGKMREHNKWIYTKSDAMGRLMQQSIIISSVAITTATLQNRFNYHLYNPLEPGSEFSEETVLKKILYDNYINGREPITMDEIPIGTNIRGWKFKVTKLNMTAPSYPVYPVAPMMKVNSVDFIGHTQTDNMEINIGSVITESPINSRKYINGANTWMVADGFEFIIKDDNDYIITENTLATGNATVWGFENIIAYPPTPEPESKSEYITMDKILVGTDIRGWTFEVTDTHIPTPFNDNTPYTMEVNSGYPFISALFPYIIKVNSPHMFSIPMTEPPLGINDELLLDAWMVSDGYRFTVKNDRDYIVTVNNLPTGTATVWGFDRIKAYPPISQTSLLFKAVADIVTPDDMDNRTQGFKTYEKVAILNGDVNVGFVERAFFYDYKGRVIQTIEKTPLGGISRYSTKYDFVGNILASHESHQTSDETEPDIKLTEFTYDHRNRLLTETTTLNDSAPAIVHYTYDDLGRLTAKTYGIPAKPDFGAITMDKIPIGTNIRGWKFEVDPSLPVPGWNGWMGLKCYGVSNWGVAQRDTYEEINSWIFEEAIPAGDSNYPTIYNASIGWVSTTFTVKDDQDYIVTSNDLSVSDGTWWGFDKMRKIEPKSEPAPSSFAITEDYSYNIQGWLTEKSSDVFGMKLRYFGTSQEPLKANTVPSYTGNISEWSWRHGANADEQTYAFSYDKLSRLTNTEQYVNGNLNDLFVEKELTYDKNGNLSSMHRMADEASLDRLAYSYTGNQLTSLTGTATGTYSYDLLGNMTHDGVNNLYLKYNCLNLIEKVERNGSTLAKYSYLADGTKLSATDADGNGLYYAGSLVYRKQNGIWSLESTGFNGGRFVATNNGAEPHYFISDHLGSVRAVINANGEVVERNDYYPFGLRWNEANSMLADNRYRYNEKEEQSFINVPYIDYGARMYDPKFRLSWNASDPLAEKYYPISTYAFCANNPINYIDPNGLEVRGITKQDAQNFRDDIYKILAGDKFANIRALIDVMGKTFKSINVGALSSAIDGVTLTDDESAYITMITSAINSRDIYKVEYISGDFTSTEGAEAFVNHMNNTLGEGMGDKMTTPDGKLSTAWIRNSGNGLNVPTKRGSHSFIGTNLQGAERAVISGHEVFGHGIPAARKLTPAENNANAIRTDNLIRRILGLPQRDGSNHGGYQEGHITNPYILPIIQ